MQPHLPTLLMASTALLSLLSTQRAAAGQLCICCDSCCCGSGWKPAGRFIIANLMAFHSLLHQ
jgi:hypothetical protein